MKRKKLKGGDNHVTSEYDGQQAALSKLKEGRNRYVTRNDDGQQAAVFQTKPEGGDNNVLSGQGDNRPNNRATNRRHKVYSDLDLFKKSHRNSR